MDTKLWIESEIFTCDQATATNLRSYSVIILDQQVINWNA